MRDKTLVLIHGWGMNRGIWQDLIHDLANMRVNTLVLDLPGYNGTKAISHSNNVFGDTTQALLEQLPQDGKFHLLGWSLGGLFAIQMARIARKRFQSLILLSSNPKFVASADWSCAVQPQTFAQFLNDLQQDNHKTIQRFIAIQCMGSKTASTDRKKIHQALSLFPYADSQTLADGLDLLLKSDARSSLDELQLPVSLIGGTHDALVPIRALELLSSQYHFPLYSIQGAGHAPFISHKSDFMQYLEEIMREN